MIATDTKFNKVGKFDTGFQQVHLCSMCLKISLPQISEGFRATTNNSEENIVRSIGTFTTKQFFTEKWKTERRMRKSLRLPPHLE